MADHHREPSGPLRAVATAVAVGAVAATLRSGGRPDHPPGSSADAADEAGRTAESPAEVPPRGWWEVLTRVYTQIDEDRILAVAAGVTFYALLALFPAIAAFVSIYGLFADPVAIEGHLALLADFLPGGALQVIAEQVKRIAGAGETTLGVTLLGSLAVSLWSANAGMKAMFDALNVAYDEEEKRSFVALTAQSLLFTILAILFLMAAVAAVVIVPVLLNVVGLGALGELVLKWARWPVLLAGVIFALAVLYRYGPSRDEPKWRWVTWGSGIAAVLWVAGSILFSWYAENFGSYNETYGSLGAVVGFMTWIWLSTTVILVGAELNAELEHQTARDTTVGPDRPIGTRGAEMADRVAPSARSGR